MGNVSGTFHGQMFTSPFRLRHVSKGWHRKHMACMPNNNKPVSAPMGCLFRAERLVITSVLEEILRTCGLKVPKGPSDDVWLSKSSAVSLSTAVNAAGKRLLKPQSNPSGGQWGQVTREI